MVARPAGAAGRAAAWTGTRRARSDSTCSSPSATHRAASPCCRNSRKPTSRTFRVICPPSPACAASSTTTRASRRRCAADPRCWRSRSTTRSRRPACCRRRHSRRRTLARHVIPIAPESRLHGQPGRTAARRGVGRAHRPGLRFRRRGAPRAAGEALRERLLSGAGTGGRAGRASRRSRSSRTSIRTAISISLDLGGLKRAGRQGRHGARAVSRQGRRPSVCTPRPSVMAGEIPADKFPGAIVLVGTTAKGLQDARSTPEAPDFPGVEIHANLLDRHPERRHAVGARRCISRSRCC